MCLFQEGISGTKIKALAYLNAPLTSDFGNLD